jgi:PAS domain S-box-containing protein
MDSSLHVREGSPAPAPARHRHAVAVFAPATAIVLTTIVAERFVHERTTLQVLDNVHWTVSFVAAAILAWLGAHASAAGERSARRWIALGFSGYAIGQILWDVQVACGWNPFPGPSDAFFLLLGPLCGFGLAKLLWARTDRGERRTAALDFIGLSVSVLAFVLAEYLPLRGKHSALEMAVLVAYPVALFSAACLAVVMVPTLRLRAEKGWILFLAALSVNGWLWIDWNARTLAGTLADGTLYNASFSLVALAMGLGAMWWRAGAASGPRWERRYEGLLRVLPLLLVLGAAGAVVIAFTSPEVPTSVQLVVGWGGAIVVTISIMRQNVMLDERDRMLEAQNLFRTLFSSAQDAILLMNANGFLDCNPSAERMYGAPREVICRLGPLDFSPAEQPDGRASAESAREKIRSALSGESQSFAWLHHRRDGTPFYAEVSLDGVTLPHGRILQAVVRDVTERHEAEETRGRLEERLRHASRLEAVGRLAGGVAHDFNNILTVILGTTEMALMRAKDSGTHKDLGEIRRSAKRAASLTAQLLAFSRRQVMAPVPSDLNALVGGAVDMLQRLIGEDIELSFDPGEGMGAVLVDPTQVEQVLVNLAVNARDAMPQGGSLRLATSALELDAEACATIADARPGRFVRLEVSDNGPGIPPEIIEHVFEPFYTTQEFGRGTGLGLSTVYGIVRQSEGFISLSSVAGEGTSFRVHFPEIAAAPKSAPGAPREAMAPGSEHVLLVEDEAMVRDLAEHVLSGLGYRVSSAGSGAEALALVAALEAPIDLLLTDVIMPSMSGRELHERLLRGRPGLPVLFMSGYTDNVIAPHGVLDAGTHFIQKPFTMRALAALVRSVLDGRAADRGEGERAA